MKIRVENGKPVVGKSGRSYFSFWIRISDGMFTHSESGWKYFPDTQTVSAPSVMKGKDGGGKAKFINTTKPNPAFFNEVRAQAEGYFDGESLTAPTEEQTEVVDASV
jgi:hypothetical protein